MCITSHRLCAGYSAVHIYRWCSDGYEYRFGRSTLPIGTSEAALWLLAADDAEFGSAPLTRHVVAGRVAVDHAGAARARSRVLIATDVLCKQLIRALIEGLPLDEPSSLSGIPLYFLPPLFARLPIMVRPNTRRATPRSAHRASEAKSVVAGRAIEMLVVAHLPCEYVVAARVWASPKIGAVGA